MTSGHYDPADLSPYLEKDNQDQLVMLKIILKLLYPDGISHFNENAIGSAPSCNTTVNQNTTEPLNMSCDSTVIETEILKSDKKTVDLKTQDSQQNSKQYPIPKKIIPPKYKSKRMKKYGNIHKIQFPGVYKMKFKPFQRNEKIYWSKKLWCANNVSHNNNSYTLHKFCHMTTSNINGLHTLLPQNMLLLKRPRVKIK